MLIWRTSQETYFIITKEPYANSHPYRSVKLTRERTFITTKTSRPHFWQNNPSVPQPYVLIAQRKIPVSQTILDENCYRGEKHIRSLPPPSPECFFKVTLRLTSEFMNSFIPHSFHLQSRYQMKEITHAHQEPKYHLVKNMNNSNQMSHNN